MKKFWMAALCAVWLGHVPALLAQTTWKLATGYRAESFQTQNIMQFSREVELATRGKLLIEVYPNNAIAKLNDISQAVQQGKAEAGETIMTSLVKDIPIAGADSIPFVVGSYRDAERLWKLQRPGIEKHFAQRGPKLLYTVPWPSQGLHSNKPIRGLADFKGTQMRTYNSTILRIAEMLGARPVDVAMVDVGKALAEGRMDNMITSALTGVENKVWGPIKYYYEINAWFPKNVVFVSSKVFDALPAEARTTRSLRRQPMLKPGAGPPARLWRSAPPMSCVPTASGLNAFRQTSTMKSSEWASAFRENGYDQSVTRPTPFLFPITFSKTLCRSVLATFGGGQPLSS